MNSFLPRLRFRATWLAAGLAVFTHFTAVAADSGLSLEEIVNLRAVSKAVLSPDGDAVAYLLSVPRALY